MEELQKAPQQEQQEQQPTIEEIVKGLVEQGKSKDEIVEILKGLLQEGKIDEETFNKGIELIDNAQNEDKKASEDLFGIKML